jgi:hypothetical protein
MSARVAIGVIALVCTSICGLIGSLTGWQMMDQVNAKLPKAEQFGVLGWYTEKTLRLHREYRRLYPGGRLLFKIWVLFGLGLTCLLISAWAFRFFSR